MKYSRSFLAALLGRQKRARVPYARTKEPCSDEVFKELSATMFLEKNCTGLYMGSIGLF